MIPILRKAIKFTWQLKLSKIQNGGRYSSPNFWWKPMFNIQEYCAPSEEFFSSREHEKFLSSIKRELESVKLENKKNNKITISVKYGNDLEKCSFHIIGYDLKNFGYKDDIEISALRAALDNLVKNQFCSGIDNNKFQLVLSFNKEPFINLPKIKKPLPTVSDEPKLTVLPVEPRYKLEQMILEDDIQQQLEDVVALVNMQDKIYNDWGFEDVDPKPRAIINFFGPSGTGKTMAAHALAHKFGVKILSLNYADIESKFVGDAPKNLMAAFDIAREHNALLFFDEADSFLGKRITNVTHSADQAVNSLRSQLLMLLEEHSGTVIFATNLIENYDSAFQSRILKHIKFSLPTKKLRLELIKKMMPPKLPYDSMEFNEENLAYLVELSEGFSGREIKNAVLNGIIRSAKNKDCFVYEDAKVSFEEAAKSKEKDKRKKQEADSLRKRVRDKIRKSIGFKKQAKKKFGGKKRWPYAISPISIKSSKNYRTVKAL